MASKDKLRLAILGVWHVHAKDHLASARASQFVELVGVWDADSESAKSAAAEWHLNHLNSLEAILSDRLVDGVIVTTDTASHAKIITAAAKAGKHIFSEKVIASTREEVDEILDAVSQSGVHFGVTLPRVFKPYTKTLKRLLEGDRLGEIVQARLRISHDGALPSPDHPTGWLPERFFRKGEARGGALIDLGAHPLYLALFLFGFPSTVDGKLAYATDRETEDAATAVLYYTKGPIVTCEVSFCAPYRFSIELFGTRGSVSYIETREKSKFESEKISVPPLGEFEGDFDENPFDRWIGAILADQPDKESLNLARNLTLLIEEIYAKTAGPREVI